MSLVNVTIILTLPLFLTVVFSLAEPGGTVRAAQNLFGQLQKCQDHAGEQILFLEVQLLQLPVLPAIL